MSSQNALANYACGHSRDVFWAVDRYGCPAVSCFPERCFGFLAHESQAFCVRISGFPLVGLVVKVCN